MSIDVKAIENAVINTLKTFIGDDVAKVRGQDIVPREMSTETDMGTSNFLMTDVTEVTPTYIPAILPARVFSSTGSNKNPPIPDYPYCLVDYIRTVPNGSDLTDRFFDDEGNYVYLSHKKVIIQIKFYGNSQNSSDNVANKTHMLLTVDEVRDMIDTLYQNNSNTGTTVTPSARVLSKSDIIPSNFSMKDKYLETNEFNLILATTDTIDIKSEQAGYFDKIEMDTNNPVSGVQGGIYYDIKGTPEQDLHVNVKAP